MVNPELLKLLVCPEDRTPLHEAGPEVLEKLNAAVKAGVLRNRGGELVADPIEAGLIREDGKFLYIVQDDIPFMLIEEAIPLEQIEQGE